MTYVLITEKELPVGFPQIMQNPGMKVVEKGRNAVLLCDATGEPRPVISWVKDTVPIFVQVRLIDMIRVADQSILVGSGSSQVLDPNFFLDLCPVF